MIIFVERKGNITIHTIKDFGCENGALKSKVKATYMMPATRITPRINITIPNI